MKCPKCQYVRQALEEAPDWQCPKCGIAYQKYKPTEKPAAKLPAPAAVAASKKPAKKNSGLFKDLRIMVLLLILLFVALDRFFMKANTSDWDQPLRVVIYPINGDQSEAAASYIATLKERGFAPINQFMRREAARYGIAINDPLDVRMAPVVNERPPLPPADQTILKTVLWSLNFRYWSFMADNYEGPSPDIRIFTLYYDPKVHKKLPHSTGIEQGMLSVVHAFASQKMAKQNRFVITHEMLHTLGATDKYSFANNQPTYPEGYAEPEKQPLYPQRYAEVMGGRIPLNQTRAEIPTGLGETMVGPLTAWEIGWQIE